MGLLTTRPYGLGVNALTISAGPCAEEHRFGRETPHISVLVKAYTNCAAEPILDAMLDRDQARAIGLALLNAAEALEY